MISVKFEQLIYFIVFPTLFILKTYIECHDMKFFINISELFLIVFFFFFHKIILSHYNIYHAFKYLGIML